MKMKSSSLPLFFVIEIAKENPRNSFTVVPRNCPSIRKSSRLTLGVDLKPIYLFLNLQWKEKERKAAIHRAEDQKSGKYFIDSCCLQKLSVFGKHGGKPEALAGCQFIHNKQPRGVW